MRRTRAAAVPTLLWALTALPGTAAVTIPAPAVEQAQRLQDAWLAETKGVEKEFEQLELPYPGEPQNADDTLPENPNGDAVAVCDGGLLFNADNYDLVYLNNVRLAEPRLHLRAAHRFYVRLRQATARKTGKDAQKEADAVSKGGSLSITPEKAEQRVEAVTAPALQQPIGLRTHDAVADTEGNFLLLYSPDAARDIELTYGGNRLVLRPSAQRAASALADAGGNILLRAASLEAQWTDEKGELTRLTAENDVTAYFDAAESRLLLPGRVLIQRGEDEIRCEAGLSLRLRLHRPQKQQKDFLAAFMGLRMEGVEELCAEQVQARYGTCRVSGDRLVFRPETGDGMVEGKGVLTYGGNRVSAERLTLLPNGDMLLTGEPRGTYERPEQGREAPLVGEFQASAELRFCAADGTIRTEKGLHMKDEGMEFRCTGPVVLTLAEKEGAEEPKLPRQAGRLNVAAARYQDIRALSAAGDVTAFRYDPATQTLTGHLEAERLEADWLTGELQLTGTPNRSVTLQMEKNMLEALPDGTTPANLHLAANGDVELRGEHLRASLQTAQGEVKAHCRELLRLDRSTDTLVTGSETEFRAPQAIVTTKGPLTAHLAAADTPRSRNERWPQHHLSYKGADRARTEQGGTVQTTKGSMECSGLIELEMQPGATGEALSGLKTARASGSVAVAGRDSSGRLVRATGDTLLLNAQGEKILTGNRVTLSDENNSHTASGAGAAVRIDARNNARITGAHHTTTATNIPSQINRERAERSKNK